MTFNKGIGRTMVALLGAPVFLMIDSSVGDAWFSEYGQTIATILVILAFYMAYKRRNKRIREIMLIGVIVGFTGEFICSIILGMYHYRLGNIPLWLGFGHSLLYALVFRFSHDSWVRKNQNVIMTTRFLLSLIYSTSWLYYSNDWFGFICTLTFLIILVIAKKSRLFFLIMYALVCYIEIIGTSTGSWDWPQEFLGKEGWIQSANPPTGIAVLYFVFAAIVIFVYMFVLHPEVKIRYLRIKSIKNFLE